MLHCLYPLRASLRLPGVRHNFAMADNFAALGLATDASFLGEDPTLERSFRGHKDAVSSVAWNPNLKQLITGSLDCSVMVWNFKPALRAFRFSGHKVLHDCINPVGSTSS